MKKLILEIVECSNCHYFHRLDFYGDCFHNGERLLPVETYGSLSRIPVKYRDSAGDEFHACKDIYIYVYRFV